MTLCALFVWCVVAVTGCQTAFLLWLCWPRLKPMIAYAHDVAIRVSHCPWCWASLHVMQWYPQKWSSTICRRHELHVLAQSAARRAARQARRVTPVVAHMCLESGEA